MFNVDLSKATICGHPVSLWNGHRKLHTKRALIAGEAAGIVDPFTAEGIRPSIFTGIKAAEVIGDCLAGKINSLEVYTEIIQKELGSEMAWAKRLAELFHCFPKFFYNLGAKRPEATQAMLRILNGELHYSDVGSRVLRKFKFLNF